MAVSLRSVPERTRLELVSVPVIKSFYNRLLRPILNSSLPEGLRVRERLYEDLMVVFCFVGNDFVPHSPTMKLQGMLLSKAVQAYCQVFPRLGVSPSPSLPSLPSLFLPQPITAVMSR